MTIRKGDRVRVVRGRNVPVGAEGVVFWAKEGEYGLRLGIKDDPDNDDEDPVWIDARNCEVVQEGSIQAEDMPGNGAWEGLNAHVKEILEPKIKALETERDALKALTEAQSAEIKALRSRPGTGLSPEQIEQAVTNVSHALRFSLGASETPKATPVASETPKAAPVVPEIPAPEAPKASGLKRCEKCKRFMLGAAHKCAS